MPRPKALIIGATSAIAQQTARLLSKRGAELFLVGRSVEKLETLCADLRVRGATKVFTLAVDLNRLEQHDRIVQEALQVLGRFDHVLIAHGILGNQDEAQREFAHVEQIFLTNCISTLSLLTRLANRMINDGSGAIAVITSVAGDRGRQSNYVYGASKAAVGVFLQGLRSRLHPYGIRVIELRSGPVDTPMTQHMRKSWMFSRPETIAAGIVRAFDGRCDTIYLPWFWKWIMCGIRSLPERVFKRLPG
jgi:short-subunit dehydrogenase